jgi:hypothetical protein
MSILSITDFAEGRYKIAQNKYVDVAVELSEFNEDKHVKRILGNDLGVLFIANLVGGLPQEARFISIFETFDFVIGGCLYNSLGVKGALIRLFYSYYCSKQAIFNQIGGNSNVDQEASNPDNLIATTSYNEGVTTICKLQRYVDDKNTEYPEFEYQYTYTLNALI